jgi:transposase
VTEVELLRRELEKSNAEREHYRRLYMDMPGRCKLLERGIVAGRKAERFTGGEDPQLSMQLLGMLLSEDEAPRDDALPDESEDELAELNEPDAGDTAPSDAGPPRRRSRGRRVLPETLPRVEIELLPPEVLAEGLDSFVRIGEVVSEVVERRTASLVVARLVRPKFVRKDTLDAAAATEDEPELPPVVIAEPAERPIERGLAGPALLASTIVMRWQDHLPVHRQEAIHAREGLPLARSTICNWHQQLADLVEPLVDAMLADALSAPYVCVDATGVLVQAKEQCQRAHFWVLVAPERHVLYRFSITHDKDAVDRLLSGYKGYLVADAATVYDHLFRSGDIVEVACWAHCRRYFYNALATEPELARHALGLIGRLFKIEEALATAPRKKRETVRHSKSSPIVDAFFKWCDEQAAQALDSTPIAAALRYARTSAAPCSASSPTAACRSTTTCPSSPCAARPSAAKTGSSSAATTAPTPTPSSSRSWPAARCTTSSPSATSATSSACCPPGRETASLSSPLPPGSRLSRRRKLRSGSPPTFSVASRSASMGARHSPTAWLLRDAV